MPNPRLTDLDGKSGSHRVAFAGCFDGPAWINSERMIHEKHPGSVGKPAVNLHTVAMYFGRSGVLVDALDQPL